MSCQDRNLIKTWSELSLVWLWVSLLNLPEALVRFTATAISWQEDADLIELVLLRLERLFEREATSCSVIGSTSLSNWLLLTKEKRGRSTGRDVQSEDLPIESSRWLSVLMFEHCDSNSLAQALAASVGFASNPEITKVFRRLQNFLHLFRFYRVKTENLGLVQNHS